MGGEHIDRYQPNHTADFRQCVGAKVTTMSRKDSRPGEDMRSVGSDVKGPRATSQELPEQGRVQ